MVQDASLHDPLPDVFRVAVLGAGRSGIAAARLLARFGKSVVLSDSRALDAAEIRKQLPADVQVVVGRNDIDGVGVAVLSPGIPPSAPIIAEARAEGVTLIAELELGARATRLPIIAVTGTDGKTTTTLLTAALLEADGRDVTVCGNIGTPLSEALLDDPGEWLVVEVSAFQLLHTTSFSPQVLIATNIANDHLDYFGGDELAYIRAKRRPLEFMGEGCTVILNASDPIVREWDRCADCDIAWYGDAEDLPSRTFSGEVGDVCLCFTAPEGEFTVPKSALPMRGRHNHFNGLAAGLGALAAGVDPDAIRRGLAEFVPPPHRIQTVRVLDGVTWINDSKATNAHAAMAALATIDEPTVLIAGGVDKGLELGAWIEAMRANVRAVVTIGALAQRLETEIEAAGLDVQIQRAPSMEEAVWAARALIEKTGATAVLLSPACSSFDMFDSYAHRGDVFAEAVSRLEAADA